MKTGILVSQLLLLAKGVAWFVLLCLSTSVLSQTISQRKGNLATLPTQVQITPGKVTLYADFEGKAGGRVWVYLINATSEDLRVPAQDGDFYCKREIKDHGGDWERCDSHIYASCGLSCLPLRLPAQSFMAWPRLCDSPQGEERVMRFRIFQEPPWNIASNEGRGRVSDGEITLCRYDCMAMQTGPYEDVVAVATGKVKRESDAVDDALLALRRFPMQPSLFPALKEIIAALPTGRQEERLHAERLYAACLEALGEAVKVTAVAEEARRYAAAQFHDPKFPFRDEALHFLLYRSGWDEETFKTEVEAVLAEPGHPAMRTAIMACGNMRDSHVEGNRLRSIANDPRYPAEDRLTAEAEANRILANPFLNVVLEADIAANGEVTPVKCVRLTNISPQEISLPVSHAEDLLVARVTGAEWQHNELAPRRKSAAVSPGGPLRLRSGESIDIKNFKWWRQLDPAAFQPIRSYNVVIEATSPGLWDVPAKPLRILSFEGRKIQAALDADKPK